MSTTAIILLLTNRIFKEVKKWKLEHKFKYFNCSKNIHKFFTNCCVHELQNDTLYRKHPIGPFAYYELVLIEVLFYLFFIFTEYMHLQSHITNIKSVYTTSCISMQLEIFL